MTITKERVGIYLDAKLRERLRKAAKKAKVSVSTFINAVVEEALKIKK